MLGKVDELHEKLDKMEKEKHAKKRAGAGKVKFVDEEEAEEEASCRLNMEAWEGTTLKTTCPCTYRSEPIMG